MYYGNSYYEINYCSSFIPVEIKINFTKASIVILENVNLCKQKSKAFFFNLHKSSNNWGWWPWQFMLVHKEMDSAISKFFYLLIALASHDWSQWLFRSIHYKEMRPLPMASNAIFITWYICFLNAIRSRQINTIVCLFSYDLGKT